MVKLELAFPSLSLISDSSAGRRFSIIAPTSEIVYPCLMIQMVENEIDATPLKISTNSGSAVVHEIIP